MVDINYKIVIVAILCMTVILITKILCNEGDSALTYAIIGAICLMAGVVLPQPKIDNKRGNLKW